MAFHSACIDSEKVTDDFMQLCTGFDGSNVTHTVQNLLRHSNKVSLRESQGNDFGVAVGFVDNIADAIQNNQDMAEKLVFVNKSFISFKLPYNKLVGNRFRNTGKPVVKSEIVFIRIFQFKIPLWND